MSALGRGRYVDSAYTLSSFVPAPDSRLLLKVGSEVPAGMAPTPTIQACLTADAKTYPGSEQNIGVRESWVAGQRRPLGRVGRERHLGAFQGESTGISQAY